MIIIELIVTKTETLWTNLKKQIQIVNNDKYIHKFYRCTCKVPNNATDIHLETNNDKYIHTFTYVYLMRHLFQQPVNFQTSKSIWNRIKVFKSSTFCIHHLILFFLWSIV